MHSKASIKSIWDSLLMDCHCSVIMYRPNARLQYIMIECR